MKGLEEHSFITWTQSCFFLGEMREIPMQRNQQFDETMTGKLLISVKLQGKAILKFCEGIKLNLKASLSGL